MASASLPPNSLLPGLWLIHGIRLDTSNIVRFRHLDLGHQLPAKLTEVEGPTDNFDGINPAFFYMAVEPKIGVGWKKKQNGW